VSPAERVVTVYVADRCHLCEAALDVITAVREELPFVLVTVDVAGDDALERTYRERLPVVEIDGVHAFTYFVHPDSFRERLLGP
jgi:glutaredoxin